MRVSSLIGILGSAIVVTSACGGASTSPAGTGESSSSASQCPASDPTCHCNPPGDPNCHKTAPPDAGACRPNDRACGADDSGVPIDASLDDAHPNDNNPIDAGPDSPYDFSQLDAGPDTSPNDNPPIDASPDDARVKP
jgi:hypothetical protein